MSSTYRIIQSKHYQLVSFKVNVKHWFQEYFVNKGTVNANVAINEIKLFFLFIYKIEITVQAPANSFTLELTYNEQFNS